ncbi:MAG: RNA methyltransferase [Alphaproteobacteria bacterium]|nr:RNA methyltransferase [Alphaproteobacteria bacterium]
MVGTLNITLIRPQMGENIGSAARNMANFGLSELRLVAPRDGWPNPKASDTAGRALEVIDDASLFNTTAEAVADAQFVLATTARDRVVNLPVTTPREVMPELHAKIAAGQKVSILFGPERTGLENEDIAAANAILTIPVSEKYSSLNIAQAVGIVGYEWWLSGLGDEVQQTAIDAPAPREELLGMFGQLEVALDDTNFWRVPEKKEIMWKNIRASLMRAGFSSYEVATWRGIIKALAGK